MLFNSLEFFLFLPVALAVFAALPASARWGWLLAASCFFYGFARPANLAFLAGVTLLVSACGSLIARTPSPLARRSLLAAGLVTLIGALAAFKFHDFAAGELERLLQDDTGAGPALPRLGTAAPAGFSFYVFSGAAYLIDVFARRLPSQPHAGHLALYVAWFPKILAGPIERATTFLPQLRHGLRATPEQLVLGSQLIVWGLVKKVLIADNLAPFVDRTFNIAAYASPVDLLISVYFFAFQIYCDFSGYTDIAIGVSLLFGMQLMQNFRRPYLSRSTSEFWSERWHISLGRWFRDYLYIPLGGSRAGRTRQYLNLMLVFIASGLWHAGLGYGVGWTFLAWGVLNGGYQWAGLATRPFWRRLGAKLPRVAASRPWLVVRVLLTFHLIAVTWIFFRAKTLADAWTILCRIASNLAAIPGLLAHYPFTPDHLLGFALIGALLAIELLDERRSIFLRLAAARTAWRWAASYAGIFAVLVLGRWQSREFIYMQF
ncbi:MBOAT family protein [Ramlibacter sp. RBP-2]|uniref:Probable alginate O-acetylase AlgI n=1 Tax=Ramlibacter lithotrophicus TaxID=2606681 RepID=A0A7X6DEH9_9BURK|nr:MBOAT family O-acyltransferase [Ramlibacter lithotrophicus]NKE65714.1 MBOAT family protein [Ramlibacter lithotrophicus]